MNGRVLSETSYGLCKRLECLSGWINRHVPRRVLDVGCGSGAFLTIPLAEAHPDVIFVGVDQDEHTIRHAQASHRCPNLRFLCDWPDSEPPFDLVIASEVIEHVEDPDGFLEDCLASLRPGGYLVVTLPNGLGPFEWAGLARILLEETGLLRAAWTFRGMISRRSTEQGDGERDTLADSPHINYFTFDSIRRLFRVHGLDVVEYRPRTWLCGFGFDSLLRSERLCRWNARVADCLPPPFASAWMFLLARSGAVGEGHGHARSGYAWWRRGLNGRRG